MRAASVPRYQPSPNVLRAIVFATMLAVLVLALLAYDVSSAQAATGPASGGENPFRW